jgi:hypothetical protein
MITTTSVLTPPTLTRLDGCDRCSAGVQLIALLPAGELLFCEHHAREYRTRLIDIGARLIPDT